MLSSLGLALPSADVLDRPVITLGGTPADQALGDAWDLCRGLVYLDQGNDIAPARMRRPSRVT